MLLVIKRNTGMVDKEATGMLESTVMVVMADDDGRRLSRDHSDAIGDRLMQRLRRTQGRRIRAVRTMRRMTLRELAGRMSQRPGIRVTASAVSEWERGISTPRQHLQVALARELGVTWSDLFSLDGEVLP